MGSATLTVGDSLSAPVNIDELQRDEKVDERVDGICNDELPPSMDRKLE